MPIGSEQFEQQELNNILTNLIKTNSRINRLDSSQQKYILMRMSLGPQINHLQRQIPPTAWHTKPHGTDTSPENRSNAKLYDDFMASCVQAELLRGKSFGRDTRYELGLPLREGGLGLTFACSTQQLLRYFASLATVAKRIQAATVSHDTTGPLAPAGTGNQTTNPGSTSANTITNTNSSSSNTGPEAGKKPHPLAKAFKALPPGTHRHREVNWALKTISQCVQEHQSSTSPSAGNNTNNHTNHANLQDQSEYPTTWRQVCTQLNTDKFSRRLQAMLHGHFHKHLADSYHDDQANTRRRTIINRRSRMTAFAALPDCQEHTLTNDAVFFQLCINLGLEIFDKGNGQGTGLCYNCTTHQHPHEHAITNHHALTCKGRHGIPRRNHRHNRICTSLQKMLRSFDYHAVLEPRGWCQGLTPREGGDVAVYNPLADGRWTVLDVSIITEQEHNGPLTSSQRRPDRLKDKLTEKNRKYLQAHTDAHHNFQPLVLDQHGSMADTTHTFIRHMAKHIHYTPASWASPTAHAHMMQAISVMHANHNAAMLNLMAQVQQNPTLQDIIHPNAQPNAAGASG